MFITWELKQNIKTFLLWGLKQGFQEIFESSWKNKVPFKVFESTLLVLISEKETFNKALRIQ